MHDPPTLVVNADDLGLTDSANAGVFLAHRAGIVTSASLVVTTPACDEAAAELPKYPKLGVGLHLCLTAGRAVAGPKAVPDLVDAKGYLRWRFAALLVALRQARGKSLLSQIEIELEAQIEKARALSARLDHINSERHVHLIPQIMPSVAAAAVRHRIPHVRLIDDVGGAYLSWLDACRAAVDGGLLKSWLLARLTKAARRFVPAGRGPDVKYASLLYTGRMDRVLPAIWRTPSEGVTEVAVHPGLPDRPPAVGPLGNASLARYLGSPARRLETEACLALKSVDTRARLSTFGEVYGPAPPRPPKNAHGPSHRWPKEAGAPR